MDHQVDSLTPTVAITAYQAAGRNISVSWNGSDPPPGSGPLKYDVEYRIGNGPLWTRLLTQTTQVMTNFVGTFGYTYTFQVQATDPAGNKSLWAQTTTPVQIERVTKYYLFGGSRACPEPVEGSPCARGVWYTICTATISAARP